MTGRVKNIIVVDDTADNYGGTAQIAYVTCRILRDCGYNVIYFAGAGPIHERLSDFRVEVVRDSAFLDSPNKLSGALEGLHSKKAYSRLRSLLNEFNPSDTVLHVHSWTHALSSSIFDAIADFGFKSLVTLHDYFLVCPNGGFYNFQTNEICKLNACSRACIFCNCDKRSYFQKLYRLVRTALQNRSISRANPTFCYLSSFTYNIMQGNRFDSGKPIILPNPIAIDNDYHLGAPPNRRCYLFVGRLDKEKNPALFCEALTRLGLPGTLCGTGTEYDRLRRQYPNLEFRGWCDKDALDTEYKSNRALVMTSSLYEASPLVCLEAMFASGIPSVVPDTCGAISYIDNEVNGFHFKNKNLDSLCETLLKVEDGSIYSRVCSNIQLSLPRLKKDRSYETYANRVIELYEALYE